MPEQDKREVNVVYYAVLREQAGKARERRLTAARTARELYEELQRDYRFNLHPHQLAVSVNEELRSWDNRLQAEDLVVFIPPVAGG